MSYQAVKHCAGCQGVTMEQSQEMVALIESLKQENIDLVDQCATSGAEAEGFSDAYQSVRLELKGVSKQLKNAEKKLILLEGEKQEISDKLQSFREMQDTNLPARIAATEKENMELKNLLNSLQASSQPHPNKFKPNHRDLMDMEEESLISRQLGLVDEDISYSEHEYPAGSTERFDQASEAEDVLEVIIPELKESVNVMTHCEEMVRTISLHYKDLAQSW